MKKISETVKEDFPTLTESSVVYLDSAATSQTPQSVIDAMSGYYTQYRSSTHRGLYPIAERATQEYEDVRERVADFIGASKDEIVFTSGATMSSNMLVYSLENSLDLKPGDEIVTSMTEHHAGLLPLQELAKRKKLDIKYIPLTEDFRLDYDAAQELITEKTKILSVMLSSNVLGTIHDIPTLSELARKHDTVVVCDATASVGHIPVDVKELDVDFLYFSGHKMCGPTGVGVLFGKKEKIENLNPSLYGGGMINSVTCDKDATWAPDISRFEAGTPNIAGVIGLGSAIEYLQCLDVKRIHSEVQEVVVYAIEKLGKIDGVDIYAEKNPVLNAGIVSFTVEGIHPHDMAQIAGEHNVALRAGHHCAMPLMHALDVMATTRASFYLYSTKKDVDMLCDMIHKAQDIFNG